MELVEHKWAKQAGLEGLLNIQWTIPRLFTNLRGFRRW
jgi:hypothetical protein